jgi:hypothetical protein
VALRGRGNRFLKLTLTIFVETRTACGGRLMSRVLGRGSSYELHMIHNVRPATEFSGSPRWPALVTTLSILIGLAALLLFVLKG